MAKKSRTPPPPRRVQAPKTRTAGTFPPPAERRRFYILVGVAVSGVIALAAVLIFLAASGGGGGSSAKVAATLNAAGCTFKTYPSQGQQHVGSLTARVKYKSFPPTSGPHYGRPAIWGAYPTSLSQVQAVHNLEHGGIVIQYGSKVPEATVSQLAGFYNSDPSGLLMAPLPALGDRIALTAWTHLGTCTRFDEKAFKAFRDAFRYKGPERVPKQFLQPGQ